MESGERPLERVILVGFMGSGKTSVGGELAARLGWDFLDFDREIEEREGRSIARIFRDDGERTFRRLEADLGARLLGRKRVVLATGGGWAAAEGRVDGLPPGTLSVWLKVSPETAVRRASEDEIERPLLEGADPVGSARALLEAREPFYSRADLALESEEKEPDELARIIAERIAATAKRKDGKAKAIARRANPNRSG